MPTPAPNPKLPITSNLRAEAGDAAWRLAASQFVKLTRDPLVGLLSRHLGPGDDALRARIAAFLETELGTALLAGLLGTALASLPLPASENEAPEKIARELRVRAMAGAGDVVADVLMGPLREVMALYLRGVPEPASPATAELPAPAPSRLPDATMGSAAPHVEARVVETAKVSA